MTEFFDNRPVHLYWFSGSGNTLIATLALAERFRELGLTVELRAIEQLVPFEIDTNAIIGLCFPTHCFTLPEIVRSFVDQFPNVSNTPIFMLTTAGVTTGGGVRSVLKQILTEKGFFCFGAKKLIMPDSFFAFVHGRLAQWQIHRALKKVRDYANQLITAKTKWRAVPVISVWWAFFMRHFFACRNLLAPFFRYPSVHSRHKRCTCCGLCAKYCPVSALSFQSLEPANPEYDDVERQKIRRKTKPLKSPPTADRRCTLCLRCVSVCPYNAMRLRLLMLPPYRPDMPKNVCKLFNDNQ